MAYNDLFILKEDFIMKKIALGLAAIMAVSAGMAVSASAANQPGTPIYYTETEAFVNGQPIPAWNADDHTVVSVWDLGDYGFRVDTGDNAVSVSVFDDPGVSYTYAGQWAQAMADGSMAASIARAINNSAYAGQVFRVTENAGPTVYINGIEVASYTAGGDTFIQFRDLVLADDSGFFANPGTMPFQVIHKGYSAANNKTWIDVDLVGGGTWAGSVSNAAVVDTRTALDKAIEELNENFRGLEIPWSGTDYLAAYPNDSRTEWVFPVNVVTTGEQIGVISLDYNVVDQDEGFNVAFGNINLNTVGAINAYLTPGTATRVLSDSIAAHYAK